MKKALILSAVIGIIFIMSNCDNSVSPTDITTDPPNQDEGIVVDPPNPLVGTWVAATGSITIFTETTVTVIDQVGRTAITGTYTFNDRTISVTVDIENSLVSAPYLVWPWEITDGRMYKGGPPWVRRPDQDIATTATPLPSSGIQTKSSYSIPLPLGPG